MALSVTSASFHAFAAHCRTVGGPKLVRRLRRALESAAQPVEPGVQAEAQSSMPSGYGELLAVSVRVKVATRMGARSASVRLVIYADGRSERRDVPRLNGGVLAHPLYGNRDHWYRQTAGVTAGFVDRPADESRAAAVREVRRVMDEFTAEIAGG